MRDRPDRDPHVRARRSVAGIPAGRRGDVFWPLVDLSPPKRKCPRKRASFRYGRRAIVTSGWSKEMIDSLLSSEIVELWLNCITECPVDLSFLTKLQHLESFSIVGWKIPPIDPIRHLINLRSLNISTDSRVNVKLSTFPLLEFCSLECPKGTLLFDSVSLKTLVLNRYRGKDAFPLSTLRNVETLAIFGSAIQDLRGIGSLKQLQSLRLANLRKLTSLAGIEGLAHLETLHIQSCRRIETIDEVGYLSTLRKFILDNCGPLETLKPLDMLRELEWFTFVESTNILDGDLSPLLRQKKLSKLSYQNRRHYSHRYEDFRAYTG
jgi:hypothetical protein